MMLPRNMRACRRLAAFLVGGVLLAAIPQPVAADTGAESIAGAFTALEGEALPTGLRITPEAAPGADFEPLNPDLPSRPQYLADHAVAIAISPDGGTMLVLTSGFNRNFGANGVPALAESNEYVFVYDISGGGPVKSQVLQLPNTFHGIAWNPGGKAFYVSGGSGDNVHAYKKFGSRWVKDGLPIPLGHGKAGAGLNVRPMAAGLSVNDAGDRLLVANYYNDSVSLIDLATHRKIGELDLRPGKIDPRDSGTPGGEYPFAVAFAGNDKAYVSSQRDREIVVLSLARDRLGVTRRIKTDGQPNSLLVYGSRLYAASDNSDRVIVVDTALDAVIEEIDITAPKQLFANARGFKGSNPDNLALSPDGGTLFVTNGGTNTVAVVQLARGGGSQVLGLIPTGWYPTAVAVDPGGGMLYVVNGKSNPGGNSGGCRDTLSIRPGSLAHCRATNEYVWQLEKAGLLSLPMPDAATLARLTWQSALNNNFPSAAGHRADDALMAFLRGRIKHVIYIVKENRTYDQLLGDLDRGNGDPDLAILAPYSPNHQMLARQFVTFDNFLDSGESSSTGWNWSTAGRATDALENIVPVFYAGRGLAYEGEGTNRNVNVSLPTVGERLAANPDSPTDPDLLPGTADVAAPDAPDEIVDDRVGTGYLWDSALRRGLEVRNYGFYGDDWRYNLPIADPDFIALSRHPFADGVVQFYSNKQSLADISDPYFRAFDQKYPDYWRFKEWEREFDRYVAEGRLPNLSLVRLVHDHFGSFGAAIDGLGTVEAQMADNDYAVGLLVDKIAHSPFRSDTLVFVIEDDAQDGGDHVSAHRSVGYIIGPYVKKGAVVSTPYTTVNMLRTIEEVLDIAPLGLIDGLAAPMADAFDPQQQTWSYDALLPPVLKRSQLPVGASVRAASAGSAIVGLELARCFDRPKRTAAYWQAAMAGQDFADEDRLDVVRFNQALWTGLARAGLAYPDLRRDNDLGTDREPLLRRYRAALDAECGSGPSGH